MEIRGWGGGGARSSRALDKAGGLGLPKKFFWPFLPQFGLRMSGGTSPGSTTGNAALTKRWRRRHNKGDSIAKQFK